MQVRAERTDSLAVEGRVGAASGRASAGGGWWGGLLPSGKAN